MAGFELVAVEADRGSLGFRPDHATGGDEPGYSGYGIEPEKSKESLASYWNGKSISGISAMYHTSD